ncbi:pts system lactose-specific transporter subunit EIIBC [Streptococcus pneumoniae]|nr:pts system lactose-specific transporter subunit EIIBC [Streptococcus pneumoniae]
MMAIKDGFIATMPLIMFSSFLMIIIMIPKNFGVELPSPAIVWMRKVYMLTMGVLGIIVSGTVGKSLVGNVNRKMPHKFVDKLFRISRIDNFVCQCLYYCKCLPILY